MAERRAIIDMSEALEARLHPTVTLWNRVEGRPRTVDFSRALRAEIRDALWMLSRQFQLGEFRGEDAGSPVTATLRLSTTRLTRLQPGAGAAVALDDSMPLETRVERQPLPLMVGRVKGALDLRLALGRRWLKQLAAIGDYGGLFMKKYAFDLPDPRRREDAAVCANAEVWQSFLSVAGRALDGALLYAYLTGAAGRHAYDAIAVLETDKPAIDLAAASFVSWVESLVSAPEAQSNAAWQPARFEHHFACSAPETVGQRSYAADEYDAGALDWHSVDLALGAPALLPTDGTDAPATSTRTMIPVPVTYTGMPHPRFWTIEDGRVNFGEVRPDTTDLAKLLFVEFGLVYSNDWFSIPVTLPLGAIASVQGLVVDNVFGERFFIEAAGRGVNDGWQRFGLFVNDVRGDAAARAEPALLFLPTVARVQVGEPLEDVLLIRDEMANLVWGVERTIHAPDGRGRSGVAAGRETRAYHERRVSEGAQAPLPPLLENAATIRYDLMSAVPEHWIPFIATRVPGTERSVELQRSSLLRIIERDPLTPEPIKPRTTLLRPGLDATEPSAYFVPEEEVPRAGARVTRAFRRARWVDGRVYVWLAARKQVGRGEGSSGLAYDQVSAVP